LREFKGVYRMKVFRRSGKTLSIPSRHFEGIGQFEDRGPQYREFLHHLHEGCVRANPGIEYVVGSTLLYWMGWIFLLLGTVLGGGMAASPFVGIDRPHVWNLWMIPALFGVGASFVLQGRVRRYEPDAIPAKFLPEG